MYMNIYKVPNLISHSTRKVYRMGAGGQSMMNKFTHTHTHTHTQTQTHSKKLVQLKTLDL